MWFGRTWRGRAGPKVISRGVTSETHFPTIKEREKLSGPNIARFHGIGSNICMCVCVCELYLPAAITHRHTHTPSFPTLNSDRAFPNVFTYKENHLPPKNVILSLIQMNKQREYKVREEMTDDIASEGASLFSPERLASHTKSLQRENTRIRALSEIPLHHVCACLCVH